MLHINFFVVLTTLSELSIWISASAVLVSLISLGVNYYFGKKLNILGTKNAIYQQILNPYLLEKFPNGLLKVLDCSNPKEIVNYRQDLKSAVRSCLKSIVFFKIEDDKTYDILRDKLITIDDILHNFRSPHKDFATQKDFLIIELKEFYLMAYKKYGKG